jgi:hypothetical protein
MVEVLVVMESWLNMAFGTPGDGTGEARNLPRHIVKNPKSSHVVLLPYSRSGSQVEFS